MYEGINVANSQIINEESSADPAKPEDGRGVFGFGEIERTIVWEKNFDIHHAKEITLYRV